MRRTSLLYLLLALLTALPIPAHAGKRAPAASQTSAASEQEVLSQFEQILDLWRAGRYDDLYQRTNGGRDSKETFAKKLASAPRKPACCWEKIQEARVSLKDERKALVQARLGFEGSLPGTQFVTKGVNLKKEEGVWTISQSELFSLADYSSRKRTYKYLPIQGK